MGIIPANWRLEVTRHLRIRAVFKSRWMPVALTILNMFMFTVILMAGFFGGLSAGKIQLKIFGVRPAHKMFGLNKRWRARSATSG